MIDRNPTLLLTLLVIAMWAVLVSGGVHQPLQRVPKQIHTKAAVVETDDDADHQPAETHFGGGPVEAGGGGHGKYFMYQHLPHHDHYEFGYRRGNEHHFKERYEKAHPHHGHFKTKARWGDKHGGYGEHYWDYNHGGHHNDEGGSNDEEGGDGTNPVPDYHMSESQDDRVKRNHDHEDYKASASSASSASSVTSLAYDLESDTVVDESTGQRYYLTPIN